MITSTPVAFSNARILRPSRPMMRPFMSSVGMSTVLVVVSAVCAAAIALEGGDEDLSRLFLAPLGDLFFVLQDQGAGLLLQLVVQGRQKLVLGLVAGQP